MCIAKKFSMSISPGGPSGLLEDRGTMVTGASFRCSRTFCRFESGIFVFSVIKKKLLTFYYEKNKY